MSMSTTTDNTQLSVASISTAVQDPVFPFDIFELIVKTLARSTNGSPRCNNRSEIATLRLVSKSFSELCRPYLFRDVDIYMDPPIQKIQQFAVEIKENPTIAKYIQNLSYYEASRTFYWTVQPREVDCLGVFLTLPSVRYLQVDGRGYRTFKEAKGDAPKITFRSLLDHYISVGMLTALVIRSVSDIPIITIMACPNLEALELHSCNLQGWSTPLPVEVLTKGFRLKTVITCSSHDVSPTLLAFFPYLESIRLTKLGGFFSTPLDKFPILVPPLVSFDRVTFIESRGSVDWRYFCSLADSAGVKAFPALKRLHLEIYAAQDISHGINLIFGHVDSLEELKLVARNDLSPTLLDLKKCFTLSARTLTTITINWTLRNDQDVVFLETLCDALQPISHINVLQNIDINLDITKEANQIPGTLFEQWERLDVLLMQNKWVAFPHLREMRVFLRYAVGSAVNLVEKEKEYEGLLKEALIRCITRPAVEIVSHIYPPN